MTTSGPNMRSERRALLAVGLALAAWAWLAAPIGELPRSASSWDALHSGRRFAERGFLESKLQPVWSPPNHEAPYLTYTHYPPLPYWIAGAVESVVRDPLARIDVALRLVFCAALAALLCGYVFLRSLALSPPAAALACALLVWSGQWWNNASGELSWASWLGLFLLGGVAALGVAFVHWETRGRLSVGLMLLGAIAAALSAFDAWPWFPTLLAVLALDAWRRRPERLRALVLATALVSAASLAGAATRVAINWWHFGSVERVVQDVVESYSARSTYAYASLEIAENRANYMELPGQPAAPHLAWVLQFWRTLPSRLGEMFLPEPVAARWALGGAALLALLAWLFARRPRPETAGAPAPGRLVWLSALSLAGVPFVLLCPAIAVQQVGPLLAFAPAVLLASALAFESLLALLRARLGATQRLWLGITLVTAAVASPVVREPEPSPAWPAPPERCEAALRVLAATDGVVFVDLESANPLMFLAPLDTELSIKPIWTQARYFKGIDPLRILRIDGQGRLSERALAGLQPVDGAGLPEGFELLVRRPR